MVFGFNGERKIWAKAGCNIENDFLWKLMQSSTTQDGEQRISGTPDVDFADSVCVEHS